MKRIKERLAALEEGSASDQKRITCIELVDAETGEVGGVIHIGGQPDQAGVMQALKYKHKARLSRKLTPREQGSDQKG